MMDIHDVSHHQAGSQKAYLSADDIRKYDLQSGSIVFVDTTTLRKSRQTSLCRLWPSQHPNTADHTILVDRCMYSESSGDNELYNDTRIRTADKIDLHAISVHIVFNRHSSLCKSVSTQNGRNSSLSRKVRSLLQPMFLASGFTYDCLKSRLGSYFDIASLKIQFEGKGYCQLDPHTTLTIASTTSRELRDQHLSVPLTLPMATYDADLDTLIALSDRAYKGILISGVSGVGKTSLVERVSVSRRAFILRVEAAELCRAAVGEAERFLDAQFLRAADYARFGDVTLLLEDIDVVFKNTEQGLANNKRQLMTHLCSLIESLTINQSERSTRVIVIATSCKASDVHESLRNCNRLEKNIHLGLLTDPDRLLLLRHFTRGYTFTPDLLTPTASTGGTTTGSGLLRQLCAFTPADLLKFCIEAMKSAERDQTLVIRGCDLRNAFARVVPSALRNSDVIVSHSDGISLQDIGGLQEVKAIMKKCIEWPLKHSAGYARLGLKPTAGVLLYGPPGCAKTVLVKAYARHCCVTFLSLSGAQLFSSYVGDSEKKIAEAFRQARSAAPSILFIDEIDSVLTKRGQGLSGSGVQERVLSTLLNEMDGLVSTTVQSGQAQEDTPLGVLVVAATNRPNNLDDAILRPGRFDRIILVPIPDAEARASIVRIYSKHMNVDDNLVDYIVDRTENYTGADLENVCREAALMALTSDGMQCTSVQRCHFDQALQIGPSLSSEEIHNYSFFR